ncbi:hypothetical protein D3C72_2240090 [compost metagenome]
MFIRDLGSPQQSSNPEQHLINIQRLHHIIIRPSQEALFLIFEFLFGRHHQNREIEIGLPHQTGQFKSIHPWHHNIADHQVYLMLLQK